MDGFKCVLNEKEFANVYNSQCGEDEFLHNRYFKNKSSGTYIELGALDGTLYSNTKFFEDIMGWTGILIEPHPLKFQSLVKNRPRNYLFNNVVSTIQSEVSFRLFVDNYAGVSGVENTLPYEHFENFFNKVNDPQARINLIPRTLTSIVKETQFKHIDLLSLDVEGHEYEVLMSWDFSVPIDVILIEILGKSLFKEWERGTYVVLIKEYGRIKKGEVHIIHSDFSGTSVDITQSAGFACLPYKTSCNRYSIFQYKCNLLHKPNRIF
jgi:FkbM family methyltransferase